jgi:hypothetical protein
MVTMATSMPPARSDRTADDAIARVEREEPAISRRLMVPVLDWALAKYDERPCVDRAAVLAMMERADRRYGEKEPRTRAGHSPIGR